MTIQINDLKKEDLKQLILNMLQSQLDYLKEVSRSINQYPEILRNNYKITEDIQMLVNLDCNINDSIRKLQNFKNKLKQGNENELFF